MNISSMLSTDGGNAAAAAANAANPSGVGSTTNGNAHESSIVADVLHPHPNSHEIHEMYRRGFENNVNTLTQMDQRVHFAHDLRLLKFDEIKMNNTMIRTNPITSNYVERVVAEDISSRNNKISDTNKNKDLHHIDLSKPLHHNTTRGREFKWGTTREVHKVETKGKRKRPATEETSPIKSAKGVLDDTNARSRPKRVISLLPYDDGNMDDSDTRRLRRKPVFKREDSEILTSDSEGQTPGAPDLRAAPKKDENSKEHRIMMKQYDNTYISIYRDLSRKDGPKVSRMLQQHLQAKLINFRKTSILAAREAKRWQLKSTKNLKDLTTKARRAMREMFNFWKRNERVERELKKKYERELIDKAKKEEEDREAKRQLRKLNFLITQTELYSHFIGKKIKTDEIEGANSDPRLKAEKNKSLDKYADVDMTSEKHQIEALDFENADDEALHRAAAANAQNALQAAQDKAKTFGEEDPLKNPDTNGEEMNFQNPTLMGDLSITQPKLLKCTLKEYQIKGLNWLANLYEQGINGILADEMGLGKTVQSISVLSYLAETHNIWGPYLVVTPALTLHNWQQEILKFVPDFKVLPYWGSAKDRKILRKFWDRKNVRYGKDAPFHVLVTSYQLVVADAAYFQKMKWQYMILDEAQAIKSSQSSRWKSLLSFSCRNRLLLTGTPIQNSMQELWALLHFIMPSLFDSHDEFSDWFSKDIESHAQLNTTLDEQQLRRLHVILKPFMLRRIKKNVQSELGDKVEIDIFCDLTNRQKKYYQMLKSQISIMDLLDTANSGSDDATSLINLVMQFRKVCNHPDLFERADVRSSFMVSKFAETGSFLREGNDLDLMYSAENLISYGLPRLIYDELLTPSYKNSLGETEKLYNKFSIYDPENTKDNDGFGWLRFVDTSNAELAKLAHKSVLQRAIDRQTYTDINYSKQSRFRYMYDDFVPTNQKLLIANYNNRFSDVSNSDYLNELHSVKDIVYTDMCMNTLQPATVPPAAAPPIVPTCSTINYGYKMEDVLFDQEIRLSLMPLSLNNEYILLKEQVPIHAYPKSNMLPTPVNKFIDYSNIRMPSMNRFITDAGKLAKLDELLVDLKKNDHRVLVYFQMTKMMDLMEEYLTFRQHKYIRLDGSSKLDDRRDLVHDWQTKPEIFVFLLSTRAGGLGINLTAADTVIFYDSDWNPTIDSQAMDRAHRLGQTKQVTVYRLLAKGTIEERMRDRAKQKEQVQQVVMEGKSMINKKEEAANKKKDVAFLLLGGDDPSEGATVTEETSKEQTPASEEPKKKKKKLAKTAKFGDTGALLNTATLEEMYHENEGHFTRNGTPSI